MDVPGASTVGWEISAGTKCSLATSPIGCIDGVERKGGDSIQRVSAGRLIRPRAQHSAVKCDGRDDQGAIPRSRINVHHRCSSHNSLKRSYDEPTAVNVTLG